jgi:hypothetical protein
MGLWGRFRQNELYKLLESGELLESGRERVDFGQNELYKDGENGNGLGFRCAQEDEWDFQKGRSFGKWTRTPSWCGRERWAYPAEREGADRGFPVNRIYKGSRAAEEAKRKGGRWL